MSADTRLHEGQRERSKYVIRASVVLAGLVTFVALIVANQVIRFVGMQLTDIPEGFAPLTSALATVVVSFIYTFGAVVALSLVLHYSSTPVRHFLIIAAIGFVLSFVPMLALRASEDSTTGALIILATMHVVSAIIAVPLLLRLAR